MPKEAKEHVGKLKDEEVELLVSTYEDIKNYQDAVDETLRQVDPKKYTEIEEEYGQKTRKLNNEYREEMEKIQQEEDVALDAIEAKVSREIDETLTKQEVDLSEIEGAHDDFYSRLNLVVSSKSSLT